VKELEKHGISDHRLGLNKSLITSQPYSKLAKIYDRLMDHVDYYQWSHYILKLIHQSHGNVESLIDLSCGTGNLLSHLSKHIQKVYGCDNSIEMIDEARKKGILDLGKIFTCDIRNMAIKENSFDCALVLYDSLNYLIDDASLGNSLFEIHRILRKGGIFIFDVVSESHCMEYYRDFHESEYWGDDGYSRHSFYDPKNGYQFNEFRIVIKGQTFIEKHQQKIYEVDYLKTALSEYSFKIIGTYDDFSNDNLSENEGRLHFQCIKL
jgi:ubiquinone/menaquinone biosynthesis C-methylase UbiE